MSQPSSPSNFQALFNAALLDYEDKTGNSLVDHPFARQLQESDSVESISAILEEQAQVFREFRNHGRLVSSLQRLAGIFSSPLFTTLLGEGLGRVVRPKKHLSMCTVADRYSTAIAACITAWESNSYSIAILLAVCLSFYNPICISS